MILRIIPLVLFFSLALSSNAFSQVKHRTADETVYMGIGYKFVFLTNQTARDAYPFFQLSNGDFLKEIDGFLGVTINEKYGVEFSPSYLFTNSVSSDGFYYSANSNRRFYVPTETRLFALPLNIKFKYYPFADNYSSSLSKLYFGIGGGGMYISEEILSRIYSDDTQLNYIGAVDAENNFWTSNFEFDIGISSFSKIGYGFELSYRVVPLNQSGAYPLISSLASNLNSVNLSLKIIYSF